MEAVIDEREENSEADPGMAGASGGIIRGLGDLPPGAIISEGALAEMLGKHRVSIRRAVSRGELPPPIRFMGKPTWTAGALISHFEKRLAEAQKEAERMARKISGISS